MDWENLDAFLKQGRETIDNTIDTFKKISQHLDNDYKIARDKAMNGYEEFRDQRLKREGEAEEEELLQTLQRSKSST